MDPPSHHRIQPFCSPCCDAAEQPACHRVGCRVGGGSGGGGHSQPTRARTRRCAGRASAPAIIYSRLGESRLHTLLTTALVTTALVQYVHVHTIATAVFCAHRNRMAAGDISVAVCLIGELRTLTFPVVQQRLVQSLLEPLNADTFIVGARAWSRDARRPTTRCLGAQSHDRIYDASHLRSCGA